TTIQLLPYLSQPFLSSPYVYIILLFFAFVNRLSVFLSRFFCIFSSGFNFLAISFSFCCIFHSFFVLSILFGLTLKFLPYLLDFLFGQSLFLRYFPNDIHF